MKNFLSIETNSQMDTLATNRYNRDSKHVESFYGMKEQNHQKVAEDRKAAYDDYMGRKDLQDQINKMNEHLDGIEE